MAYWLMKSEPDVFSYTDLENKPVEQWHGVRNFTARNNMKAMKLGELAFFYHSNIGKEIVGIMKVVALAHPDSTAEPNDKGKVVWDNHENARTRQYGAGQAVAAFGQSGERRRVETHLSNGWAQEGSLARLKRAIVPARFLREGD